MTDVAVITYVPRVASEELEGPDDVKTYYPPPLPRERKTRSSISKSIYEEKEVIEFLAQKPPVVLKEALPSISQHCNRHSYGASDVPQDIPPAYEPRAPDIKLTPPSGSSSTSPGVEWVNNFTQTPSACLTAYHSAPLPSEHLAKAAEPLQHRYSNPTLSKPYHSDFHVTTAPQLIPRRPVLSKPEHSAQDIVRPSATIPLNQPVQPQPYPHPVSLDKFRLSQSIHAQPGGLPCAPLLAPSVHVRPMGVPLQMTDEVTTDGVKRFFGNMLPVRGVRAGIQTVSSTAKKSTYLSPWGDNSPLVLPNVRIRDLVLTGAATVGGHMMGPGAVELVDKCVEEFVMSVLEGGVDMSLEQMSGHKPTKMKKLGNAVTLELRIHHKLMGEDARIRLWREREAVDKTCCAKGWFCPYLYATGRTPVLERARDFGVAEVLGPSLLADASLAPTLLNSLSQHASEIHKLCPWPKTPPNQPRFRRLAVLLVGISPYRTASAWSQARIPNQGRFRIHLLTTTAPLIVPVTPRTPVCAWSPWTVGQMTRNGTAWNMEQHLSELLEYLESFVDPSLMGPQTSGKWKYIAASCLRQTLQSVQELAAQQDVNRLFNVDKAGIVMLRF